MHVRDKQAFSLEAGMMRMIGKPIDVAKRWKEEGCKLIHIVDVDALNGTSTNLDIYDNLTFFINVEVECAPSIATKLLDLKCRVVLSPSAGPAVEGFREKRLLVAKLPPGHAVDGRELAAFHDVILEEADEGAVEKLLSLGKRIIIYEKDEGKIRSKGVWGVISSS